MKLSCSQCPAEFEVPDQKLLALNKDVNLPCPSCKSGIPVKMATVPGFRKPEALQPKQPVSRPASDPGDLKKKILNSVKQLPPMPQVAQKARQVISDPKSSYSELSDVINTDQGIVTQILKLANSSYYGVSGKVSSVKHAAAVLGVKTVMELLDMACASGLLGGDLDGYDLNAGDLWEHSLAVAEAARLIAKAGHPALAEEAFSAGLIHDVGKLILSPYVVERKDEFTAMVGDGQHSFLSAEKDILGFDHAQIAADVCRQWKMPANIIDAIGHHHSPDCADEKLLTCIIHIADAAAIMSGIGTGIDGMLYSMDPDALERLKIGEEDLNEVMGNAAIYVEQTVSQV